MTLQNCQRLLKHFQDLADGTIEKPFGHKDWKDVVANAKTRAKAMEERIARKLMRPQYAHLKPKPKVKETKSEDKKDGSSSNRK